MKRIAEMKVEYRVVVTDPKGRILFDSGRRPSKSFVIQFLEFVRHVLDGTGFPGGAATDITNSETRIYNGGAYCNKIFRGDATINVSTHGIVVGRNAGSTAESNTNYKLDTQLTEGTGAGQITHGECVIVASAVVGANVEIDTHRAFTNNTGSIISVKEVGFYVRNSEDGVTHCVIRDVITEVSLPDKCSLTVYYYWRTTV